MILEHRGDGPLPDILASKKKLIAVSGMVADARFRGGGSGDRLAW